MFKFTLILLVYKKKEKFKQISLAAQLISFPSSLKSVLLKHKKRFDLLIRQIFIIILKY